MVHCYRVAVNLKLKLNTENTKMNTYNTTLDTFLTAEGLTPEEINIVKDHYFGDYL